jgi:hypothetical protein
MEIVGAAHPAGAARVVGAFGMLADEAVYLSSLCTWLPGWISLPRNGSKAFCRKLRG